MEKELDGLKERLERAKDEYEALDIADMIEIVSGQQDFTIRMLIHAGAQVQIH
jgi:hypothetical protein